MESIGNPLKTPKKGKSERLAEPEELEVATPAECAGPGGPRDLELFWF